MAAECLYQVLYPKTSLFIIFKFTVFSFVSRRIFYLAKAHGGCPNDSGWFAIVDGSGCPYEEGPKPLILYAVDQNMNFGDGEQILIDPDALMHMRLKTSDL